MPAGHGAHFRRGIPARRRSPFSKVQPAPRPRQTIIIGFGRQRSIIASYKELDENRAVQVRISMEI